MRSHFLACLLPPLDVHVRLLFVMLALIELTHFSMQFHGLVLDRRTLPLFAGFLSWIGLHWLCCAWLWYGCAAMSGRLRAALPAKLSCAAAAAGVAFGAGLGTSYLISWGFYRRSGVFPDVDVVRFTLLNARMLLKYFIQAEPGSLVVASLIGLASLSIATHAFRRQARYRPFGQVSTASGIVAGILFVNVTGVLLFFGDRRADLFSRTDAYRAPFPACSHLFRHRVNPTAAMALSCFAEDEVDQDYEIPASNLLVRRRNSVPITGSVSSTRPNVILIIVESLRHDVIGLSHQGREVMPRLNRLAREGVHFPRAYTQSVHSDYADPCFVSSQYPLRSERQYFYTSATPWPRLFLWDVLHERGYATSIISSQNEAWSNMHLFYEGPGLDWLFDSRSAPHQAEMLGDVILAEWSEATGLAGKLDDQLTRETAERWISDQAAAGRPFFTFINYQTSHFPYRLPPGRTGVFSPGVIDFEASLFGYPPARAPTVRNAYFNALHYIDDQIGAIVDHVASLELAGETIIAVAGDHGEAFHENGETGHAQSLLETVTRVPLIFYAPGRVAARTDHYLSQTIDVAPTLLGLARVSPPEAFQGIDLLDSERPPAASRIVFQHSRAGGRGCDGVVTNHGWKYIEEQGLGEGVLQWRPTDLGPERNISNDHPQIATVLKTVLRTWRRHQLAYYRWPRYYGVFHAPRTPVLQPTEIEILGGEPGRSGDIPE